MGSTFDVVVVGAAGVDTCVYLPDGHVDGADATFTDNRDGVGQAGGYAARAYASMGLRTAYVGAIGQDWAGSMVRSVLESEGVDCTACFDDPAGTARSINLMTSDGRRRGHYDGRGNPGLHPDLAPLVARLRGARLCHVNIPNWARGALPLARAAGVRVLTDLQDVVDPDDGYRLDFVDGSDAICFSTARGLDVEVAMRGYWQRNPTLVQLAGMGADGCAIGIEGRVELVPALDVDLPIVDTNGVGDCLAAGFAVAHLLHGIEVRESLRRAQLAARIICAQRMPKTRFATPHDLSAV